MGKTDKQDCHNKAWKQMQSHRYYNEDTFHATKEWFKKEIEKVCPLFEKAIKEEAKMREVEWKVLNNSLKRQEKRRQMDKKRRSKRSWRWFGWFRKPRKTKSEERAEELKKELKQGLKRYRRRKRNPLRRLAEK